MTPFRFRAVVAAALLVLATALPAAAQLPVPPGWRWVLDGAAVVSSATDKITDSTVGFARMPPGFHMTTGPGAIFYDPRFFGERQFTLEAQIFHFPNSRGAEYGLFIGGQELEGGAPRYVAFVLRGDGSVAAWEQRGEARRVLAEWRRADAVAPGAKDNVVGNLVRLVVSPKEAVLRVNRLDALVVPLEGVATNGHVGFRVGAGMNLHASTLDLTNRLAPARGE
ncbi:MAG: hypothetical protein IPK12_10540 [Gemmatimonadetes bacterium]|nr:hypothetical protein [Gemmatimonadota bacterium]